MSRQYCFAGHLRNIHTPIPDTTLEIIIEDGKATVLDRHGSKCLLQFTWIQNDQGDTVIDITPTPRPITYSEWS